jgi:hypothetical protein
MLKNKFFLKIICRILLVAFFWTSMMPSSYAQAVFNLPEPGARVNLTDAYQPAVVRGITLHPENPLEFNFLVDQGQKTFEDQELRQEALRLIKYFLAGLTVPEKELWVNLSPYEKDRIVSDSFGKTEMGRDLLAQDYMLKQLTGSVMIPEQALGRKFWDRVYKEAREKFGTGDVPLDAFNKIWVVPQKAVMYEKGNTVVIVESRLRVMLDADYIAMSNNPFPADPTEGAGRMPSELSTRIMREILVPAIEKEVNEGKTFAGLRQIYNSVILATWYKKNLRESLLGQVYANQGKVRGVEQADETINRKIYAQYVEAFRKGVYNLIREEYDPVIEQTVPRKYFTGGANLDASEVITEQEALDVSQQKTLEEQKLVNVGVQLQDIGPEAVTTDSDNAMAYDRALAVRRAFDYVDTGILENYLDVFLVRKTVRMTFVRDLFLDADRRGVTMASDEEFERAFREKMRSFPDMRWSSALLFDKAKKNFPRLGITQDVRQYFTAFMVMSFILQDIEEAYQLFRAIEKDPRFMRAAASPRTTEGRYEVLVKAAIIAKAGFSSEEGIFVSDNAMLSETDQRDFLRTIGLLKKAAEEFFIVRSRKLHRPKMLSLVYEQAGIQRHTTDEEREAARAIIRGFVEEFNSQNKNPMKEVEVLSGETGSGAADDMDMGSVHYGIRYRFDVFGFGLKSLAAQFAAYLDRRKAEALILREGDVLVDAAKMSEVVLLNRKVNIAVFPEIFRKKVAEKENVITNIMVVMGAGQGIETSRYRYQPGREDQIQRVIKQADNLWKYRKDHQAFDLWLFHQRSDGLQRIQMLIVVPTSLASREPWRVIDAVKKRLEEAREKARQELEGVILGLFKTPGERLELLRVFYNDNNERTHRLLASRIDLIRNAYPEDRTPPVWHMVKSALKDLVEKDKQGNKGDKGDKAELGGIDLDPALMDMQIRRDGDGVPLPLQMQPVRDMRIEGFMPVITTVTVVSDVRTVLGF